VLPQAGKSGIKCTDSRAEWVGRGPLMLSAKNSASGYNGILPGQCRSMLPPPAIGSCAFRIVSDRAISHQETYWHTGALEPLRYGRWPATPNYGNLRTVVRCGMLPAVHHE